MSIIRTTLLLCYLLFNLTSLQARSSFYPELSLAQKASQNLRRNPDSDPNNLLETAAQAVKSKRPRLEKYGLLIKAASKSKQKIEKEEVMKYGLPKGFAPNQMSQVDSQADSQPSTGATLLYILVLIMVGLIALGIIAAIIAGVVFLVNCIKRRANIVDNQSGKRKVSDDLLLLDHARQNVSTVAEQHSPIRN